MIRNLGVFLWNRKVGSLVAYKDRYTERYVSISTAISLSLAATCSNWPNATISRDPIPS